MPSDVKWRKREKRNDKEHNEKASLFRIAEYSNGSFFCFIFEKTSCEEKVQVNFLPEAAVRRCTSK